MTFKKIKGIIWFLLYHKEKEKSEEEWETRYVTLASYLALLKSQLPHQYVEIRDKER